MSLFYPYNSTMFNIVLTSTCNLSCNYCFAEKFMGEDALSNLPPDRLITEPNFDYILKLLADSKIKHASLLGGEPTLHPLFNKFAKKVISQGLYLSVKTNAMWNRGFLKLFEGVDMDKLNLHININGPEHLGDKEWEKVQKNVREASKHCQSIVLQVNITNINFKYQEILKLAKEIKVEGITWSPAVPIYNYSKNESLNKSDYSRHLSHRLMQMFEECAQNKIPVMGLHGPTPCMFSKEQLKWLNENQITINSHCFPVFDIFPDLTTHYCFPLKDFQKHINLKDYKSMKAVEYALQKDVQLIRPKVYPWKECVSCEFALDNSCQGGCMAASDFLKEFENMPLDILEDIPHKVYDSQAYEDKKFLRWDFEKEFLVYHSQYAEIYKAIVKAINSKNSIQEIITKVGDGSELMANYIQLIIKNMLFERYIVFIPRQHSQMRDNPFGTK